MHNRIHKDIEAFPEVIDLGPTWNEFFKERIKAVKHLGKRFVIDVHHTAEVIRQARDNGHVAIRRSLAFGFCQFFFVYVFKSYNDMVIRIRRFRSLQAIEHQLPVDEETKRNRYGTIVFQAM